MSLGENSNMFRSECTVNCEIADPTFQRAAGAEAGAQTRSPKGEAAARSKKDPRASVKQLTAESQAKLPRKERKTLGVAIGLPWMRVRSGPKRSKR
ncbi:hypothetical protein K470DRAFT_255909 [Piedraia hortae CBS 480.64]|uniref:Uncharacterized protein n=1 Tax=Piedraia hortae CBS 480.64 TaxID=1314780 RepID=A0A6A7C4W3_9PEZI|nr:hypothetical protein K470DRAFT_255909 [Piedraia hortae CBS 480.64]